MRPWRKRGQRLLDAVLVLSEQTYIDLSLRRLSQCADAAIADVIGSHCMMYSVVFVASACSPTGKICDDITIFLDITNVCSDSPTKSLWKASSWQCKERFIAAKKPYMQNE
jgi:hypothetical protein